MREIIRKSAEYLVSRFEKDRSYGFIDTKFDIISGRDFDGSDPEFCRRDWIYGWIQGRGLESLADHAGYFRRLGENDLADRLTDMAGRVLDKMELIRAANGGRLAFAMTPDGKNRFGENTPQGNFTDLFYSKGLFAAAGITGNRQARSEAEKLFRLVTDDIAANRFRTDQHGFDPKNPVAFVPGKFPQGPRMIALYGFARFAAAEMGDFYLDTAADFIRYIFEYHINRGKYRDLADFDFVESVDSDGNAWDDGGRILCDPGHALEFAGLAAKCLLEMQKQGRHSDLVAGSGRILPELFRHTFDLGFQNAGGIIKSFDLVSRRAVNSDMPWWSLPETIRAGVEIMALYPGYSDGIAARVDAAGKSFRKFLDCGCHGFACQTRNSQGEAVRVIPAVPDADPGYHTNLSLIDALSLHTF